MYFKIPQDVEIILNANHNRLSLNQQVSIILQICKMEKSDKLQSSMSLVVTNIKRSLTNDSRDEKT